MREYLVMQSLLKELKKLTANQRVYGYDDDVSEEPLLATVVEVGNRDFVVRWDHSGNVDRKPIEAVVHFTPAEKAT